MPLVPIAKPPDYPERSLRAHLKAWGGKSIFKLGPHPTIKTIHNFKILQNRGFIKLFKYATIIIIIIMIRIIITISGTTESERYWEARTKMSTVWLAIVTKV